MFGYLEQEKADLDRGFAGNPDDAPWNIAAKHFNVEVKDLLMIEDNNIELFPGYDEETREKWMKFVVKIAIHGEILERIKSKYWDISLIGFDGKKYLRFYESGFVAFYTI